MTTKSFVTLTLLAAAITLPGRAATVTLTSSGATATLTNAVTGLGQYGAQNGTLKASDINTLFGGTWVSAGQRTSDGTSNLLTVDITGSWTSDPLSGSWGIASSFWNTYSSAIITIHVGGGGHDDDDESGVSWFAWRITPNATSGLFTYDKPSKGGGFSNMELWGSGQGGPSNTIIPQNTPDAGSTLALMGLALFGLGLASRKAKR